MLKIKNTKENIENSIKLDTNDNVKISKIFSNLIFIRLTRKNPGKNNKKRVPGIIFRNAGTERLK